MTTEQKKEEIDRIFRKLKIYCEFFYKSFEESPYSLIADGLVANNNLTGMRAVDREIDGALREWGNEVAFPIRQRMRDELGEGVFNEQKKDDKTLEKIIARGIIKTEKEYRIVHERVESIYHDENKKKEQEELNELLGAWTGKWREKKTK